MVILLLGCAFYTEDELARAGDADGDGHASAAFGGDDCDDADASTHPGAEERCDGADRDCDGASPEASTVCRDGDGDGFGSTECIVACAAAGWVAGGDDCDDADAGTYPGAPPDGVCGSDANCDGALDVERGYREYSLGGPPDGPEGLGGDIAYGVLSGAGGSVLATGPDSTLIYSLEDGYTQTEAFASIALGGAVEFGDAFVDDGALDDVIVGSPDTDASAGLVAIFEIPSSGGDLDRANATAIWTGERSGDRLGASVTLVQGVPHELNSYLLAGAPGTGGGHGGAWIIGLDGSGETGGSLAAEALEISAGGSDANLALGSATAVYRAVYGDSEALIAARGYDGDAGRTDAGAVFLLGYGGQDVTVSADALWVGAQAGDAAGTAIASGDLTGDGAPEVVVGASGASFDRMAGAGAVYVIDGAAAPTGAYYPQDLGDAMLVLGGDIEGRGLGRSIVVVDATEGEPFILVGANDDRGCGDFGALYRWRLDADGASGIVPVSDAHLRFTGELGSELGSAVVQGGTAPVDDLVYDLVWVGSPGEGRVTGITTGSER